MNPEGLRRSLRIQLISQQKEREKSLQKDYVTVNKKVPRKNKKNREKVRRKIEKKHRQYKEPDVDFNFSRLTEYMHQNNSFHEKVPESIVGIFVENGKKNIFVKWLGEDSVDYISEENFTPALRNLLTSYLHSQLNQLQATCDENLHDRNKNTTDVPDKKREKNSILDFKRQQKLCLMEIDLYNQMEKFRVDVKLTI